MQKFRLSLIICIIFVVGIFLLISIRPTQAQRGAEINTPPAIQVVTSDRSGLTFDVLVPNYQLENLVTPTGRLDRITYPGAVFNPSLGQPQIPVQTALIGIPTDAAIVVEIISKESIQLSGTYSLASVPTLSYPNGLFAAGEKTYRPDEAIYLADQFFPTEAVQLGQPAWVQNQRMVAISVYPFQYNPVSGQVIWHSRVRIRVDFIESASDTHSDSQPNAANQPDFLAASFARPLLNFDQVQAWQPDQSRPVVSSDLAATQTSTGQNRYKITVTADGLYKITYDDLDDHMADIGSVDPRKFQFMSQGAEVDIYVTGEADGNFDEGDVIYFYGQKFYGDRLAEIYAAEDDLWRSVFYLSNGPSVNFAAQNTATMFEKYTDENVYWLVVGDSNGSRMATLDVDPTGNADPAETHFRETSHAEESERWYTFHYTSEDTWFWQDVSNGFSTVTNTYTTTLFSVATTPISATVRGEVVARNFSSNANDQHTKFKLNDIDLVEAYWDDNKPMRYAFEAEIDQSELITGENTLFFTSYGDGAVAIRHYFDWFEIDYQRLFQAAGNQLKFTQPEAGNHKYEISNFGDTTQVFALDITTPLTPTRLTSPATTADTVTISTTNATTATYFVASEAAAQTPTIHYYEPPDLLNTNNAANYVFIAHADFVTDTQTLANYRAQQGFTTRVIDVADLYNEFNYGISHPLAIKSFLKYAFDNWSTAPSYALLIGDGHWNYKSFNTADYGAPKIYMPPYLAWVDPWQGEIESTNLLANVSGTDPLPDVHIGRLPVNSTTELNYAIAKIINYEAASPAPWQFRMLFVADNSDSAGNFASISDNIITDHIVPEPLYTADTIYQSDFDCTSHSSAACQAVTQAITTTLNTTGTLLLSYHGHGSGRLWSDEKIFETGDITGLANGSQLPVILSMDCWDGAWAFPDVSFSSSYYPGLIEELVRANNDGAVAAFSPSGLGVASGHDDLHRGFLESLFDHDEWQLGPAAHNAKLKYYQNFSSDPYLLHTYTVIGDPALQIHRPQKVYIPLVLR